MDLNKYFEELIKTAKALKTVRVDGNDWMTMFAAVNSITMVASFLQNEIAERKKENAINDNIKPEHPIS